MSKSSNKIKIAITHGELSGISPEIIEKTINNFKNNKKIKIYVIANKEAQKKIKINKDFFIEPTNVPKTIEKSDALASIYAASFLALKKEINAIVTAPIDKYKESLIIKNFSGHTGFLKNILKAKNTLMLMHAKNLKVAIMTDHLAIKNISKNINILKIRSSINLLKNYLGNKNANIAVLSLNPHAGDKGLLGNEEINIISKAIKGIKNVVGPIPADTAFTPEKIKEFDAFLAMYHDQGMIPIKMQGVNNVVNITLGLPIIRTSPGHGVAYDIKGKNKASAVSMINAVKEAVKMVSKTKK